MYCAIQYSGLRTSSSQHFVARSLAAECLIAIALGSGIWAVSPQIPSLDPHVKLNNYLAYNSKAACVN